jgi:hypothetical protein
MWTEAQESDKSRAKNDRSRAPNLSNDSANELSPFLLAKLGMKSARRKAPASPTWKPPTEYGLSNSDRIATFSRRGSSLQIKLDESQRHYRDWQSNATARLSTCKQVCIAGGNEQLVDLPVLSGTNSPRAVSTAFRLSQIRHAATSCNSFKAASPAAAAPALSITCNPQLLSDSLETFAADCSVSPRALPVLNTSSPRAMAAAPAVTSAAPAAASVTAAVHASPRCTCGSSFAESEGTEGLKGMDDDSVHSTTATPLLAAVAAAAILPVVKAAHVPLLSVCCVTQPPHSSSLKKLEPLSPRALALQESAVLALEVITALCVTDL